MTVRIKWSSPLRVMAWGLAALLATTVTVAALLNPGSRMAPEWYRRDLTTVLPARIKPCKTFAIRSDFPGKVASIRVSPGMKADPGQILAVLESDELTEELDRAQRRLRFAESRLAAGRAGEGRGGKQMRREEFQSAARAGKAARERLAGFSIADAEKAHAEAKLRAIQVRSLLEQQLATRSELDDALAREQAELRNLKASREHWSRLKQEADLAGSQMRLIQMQRKKNGSGDVLSAQLEFEEASEALRIGKQRLQAMQVTTPQAGTVLSVEVHPGERFAAGTPLFQIADLSQLSFDVPVSAKIAEQISPGSAVMVRVPTDPPIRKPASVSSVLLVPDQDNPSYLVRVTIPNPNPAAILAGLDGAVEFPHLSPIWKRRRSY